MELKISLKFSLIYVILTVFFSKLIFLILNYQNISQIGGFKLMFNLFVFGIVFILIQVFAFKELNKKTELKFNSVLIVFGLIILFTFILEYLNDWLFYFLNNLIHDTSKSEINGVESVVNQMGVIFNKSDFSIFTQLVLIPFDFFLMAIKNLDIKLLLTSIFHSKIILTTCTLYFISLYYIFEKFNYKGIESIIPIKNNFNLLNITKKPVWWIIPIYIPFVRLIPKFFINEELSRKFNKNTPFVIGMTLFPWLFYGVLVLNKNSNHQK